MHDEINLKRPVLSVATMRETEHTRHGVISLKSSKGLPLYAEAILRKLYTYISVKDNMEEEKRKPHFAFLALV